MELAEDIAAEMTSKTIFEKHVPRRPVAEAKAIRRAAEMVMAAEHPVVLIGAAANRQRAINALRKFVDETGIYWSCTQMGKGVLDERQPGFLGCCALSAKDYVHGALDYSDLIIMVGHDESEKPPVIMRPGSSRKVIHLAFTPASVDNVYSPTMEVIGDVANAVWQIHEHIRENGNKKWDQPVFKRYKEMSDVKIQEGLADNAFPMNIARVCADLRKVLPEDGILSLDNGLYKVVLARLFKAYLPNTVLLDNALATMGAGIPNALGCKFLFPDRKVVSISGDGGAQMNLPELATSVQYGLNVVHVILNDNAFGMIKWKQAGAGFTNWGLDLKNPDFVALAKSYGAHGHRVESADEFAPLLQKCLDAPGTHVIEVPFSYEWISERLKKIPAEVHDLHKQIYKEFGQCYKEESFHRVQSMDADLVSVSSAMMGGSSPLVATSVKPAHTPPAAAPVQITKRAKTTTSAQVGKAEYTVQKGATIPFYLGVSNCLTSLASQDAGKAL